MCRSPLAFAVLAAIAAVAAAWPGPGDPAPSVTLPDTAGVSHAVPGDYAGHVILLFFWKSTSPGCMAEFSAVQAMHDEYGSQGFIPLAVNLGEDMETVIKPKARQHTFPFLRDTGVAWSLYVIEDTLPTNYVIDTAGLVVYGIPFFDSAWIASWVEPYLGVVSQTPAAQPCGFSAIGANPAVGHSAVRFDLPRAADVALRVYSVSGALVRTLCRGPMPAGTNTVDWDFRDNAGKPVGSGLYLYELVSGPQVAHAKVSVLK